MRDHPPVRLPRRRLAAPGVGSPGASWVAVLVVLVGVVVAGGTPVPSASSSRGSPSAVSVTPSGTAAARTPPGSTAPSSASSDPGDAVLGAAFARLVVVDATGFVRAVGDDGRLADARPPDGPITAIRSRRSGLVAVTWGGRVAVSLGHRPALEWRDVPGVDGAVAAAAEPDGDRLALLPAAQLGSGQRLQLEIVDATSGETRRVVVPSLQANGAPWWIADGSVALRALDRDDSDLLAFVAPATGSARTMALFGDDVVASPDGTEIAVLAADGVRIGAAADLANSASWGHADVFGGVSGEFVAGAFDAADHRFAALVDTSAGRVLVLCVAPGWQPVLTVRAPTTAALVAWLP